MSAPATPTCPLGLTPDDLSAWRDHALSPDDERRITAHASGCPACQGVLAAHEALAAALRNEPAPAPDPRNWPRLHARISGERRSTPATPTFHRAQRPAVWGSLGAVAAVLLISTLFFHLFSQQAALRGASSHIATATATPVVTPSPISTHVAPTTPIAGTQLVWQTRRAPAGIVPIATGDTHHTNAFTFAPTDARTGYLCALTETTTSTVDIWATHDGAKTWSQTYHANLDRQWQACDLMIDAGDVMRVELALMRYIGPGKTTSVAMLSVDGGKTWRDIATDHDLTDLVTQGKASIGLMSVWPPSTGPGGEPLPLTPATYPHIVISSDGWRTQQPIDSGLNAQGIVATDVWQRPGDGALLAEGYLMTPPANLADALELWQSVDLGSHWTRVPTPTNLQPFSGYLVAQPQANAPWRVCGLAQLGHGVTQTGLVGCTQDAGQTWQARPLPVFTAVCGDTCSTGEELTEAEMLPDGSLLGLFTGRVNANGAQQDAPDGGLFLLAPHATQWKDIGSIPGGGVFVRGAPTAMLFSVGGSRTLLGEPAGSIIASSPLPDARDIAVATLP